MLRGFCEKLENKKIEGYKTGYYLFSKLNFICLKLFDAHLEFYTLVFLICLQS